MNLFRHPWPLPAAARGAVVAIGNFDGVHRGHLAVVDAARAEATRRGTSSAVLTFEPHPRQLFRPDDPPFRLTPFRVKARMLAGTGIDHLVVLRFDRGFAARSARAFVEEVLVGGLGVRHVVVGADFRFGHGREGDAAALAEFGRRHGFGVTILTKFADETGGAFSASAARVALQEGRPRAAAEILGRPWEVEGRVAHGDKRGRTLGFPTANLTLDRYLRPAYGVYAVRCALDGAAGGVWHEGVANLGIRPMWRTPYPLLETHIFDFDREIYGRHLRVQMVEYLRPEARFDGLDALVAQMRQDSADARAALAG